MTRPIKRFLGVAFVALLSATAVVRAATPDAPSDPAHGERRSGAGGVSLFQAAELLDSPNLVGAKARWVDDHLELTQADGSRLASPPLDEEYVALAIRCAYLGEEGVSGKLVADEEQLVVVGTGRDRYGDVVWNKAMLPANWRPAPLGSTVDLAAGPGVGILYTAQPNKVRVTYYGPIAGTRMGKVLMEADRVLFPLMYGVDDVTSKPAPRPDIPGFMTLQERRARNWKPSPAKSDESASKWWRSGTWFVLVPDRFTLKLDEAKRTFEFAEARMKLAVWSGGEVDPDQAELAEHVCRYFPEYAEIYPVWRELTDVAKAVTFVRLLKRQGVAIDESWARNRPIERVETPEYLTRISVEMQYDKEGRPVIEKPSGDPLSEAKQVRP